MQFIGHHGDVGLWTINKLPENVRPVKGNILHKGEGVHTHAFDPTSDIKIFEDKDLNRYFVVGNKGATITHEEHKEEVFSPGTIIKTLIERKRNPFSNMISRVVD